MGYVPLEGAVSFLVWPGCALGVPRQGFMRGATAAVSQGAGPVVLVK